MKRQALDVPTPSNSSMALACLVAAAAVALLGCPPDDKRAPAPKATAGCAKVGQSCEFSPGKLGTCVQQDECDAGACFACQSQH